MSVSPWGNWAPNPTFDNARTHDPHTTHARAWFRKKERGVGDGGDGEVGGVVGAVTTNKLRPIHW